MSVRRGSLRGLNSWQIRGKLAHHGASNGDERLAEDTFNRMLAGTPLDEQESQAFAEHPLTAHGLLKKIPRFEDVAEMILLQSDTANAEAATPDVRLGASMLRVARDVEQCVAAGASEAEAVAKLQVNRPPQELQLLELLSGFQSVATTGQLRELRVGQMTAHMVLEDDVKTKSGVVVVPGKKQLTQPLLERLLRFSRAGVLLEPIRVRVLS